MTARRCQQRNKNMSGVYAKAQAASRHPAELGRVRAATRYPRATRPEPPAAEPPAVRLHRRHLRDLQDNNSGAIPLGLKA
jgi:hypothetical protein